MYSKQDIDMLTKTHTYFIMQPKYHFICGEHKILLETVYWARVMCVTFFSPKTRPTERERYRKRSREAAGTKGGTCNHKATPHSQLWHLLAQVATACSHKNS